MTQQKYCYPNRLTMHRRLWRLTQKQVAAELNVPPSTVSKWEKGILSPKIDHLISLGRLYHTLIENLYLDLSHQLSVKQHGK